MKLYIHALISRFLDICKACGGAKYYQISPGNIEPCFRCSGTGRYEYRARKQAKP